MPKPTFVRHHHMFDRSDYERFEEIWGKTIGVSAALRLAMRRLLMDHEARTRRIIDEEKP